MSGIPPTTNGGEGQQWIPPDLEWDENNHPWIYSCSQHTRHHPECNHKCGERTEVSSKLQADVINEGRAYARAGMSFKGVPAAYVGIIPVNGIAIELLDVMMWLQGMLQILTDKFDIDEFEFQEAFRAKKLELLRAVREANEPQLKQARLKQQMGVVEKKLYGPNGQPLF